jgi:hypothetical protein
MIRFSTRVGAAIYAVASMQVIQKGLPRVFAAFAKPLACILLLQVESYGIEPTTHYTSGLPQSFFKRISEPDRSLASLFDNHSGAGPCPAAGSQPAFFARNLNRCVTGCGKIHIHRSPEEQLRIRRVRPRKRRLKPTLQAEARATKPFFTGIGGPKVRHGSIAGDQSWDRSLRSRLSKGGAMAPL